MTALKQSKLGNRGFAHIVLLLLVVGVVVVVSFVGTFVFQTQADKKYQSKVKTAYDTQVAKMADAYASFSRPVFSSSDTDPESDAKDLAIVDAAIAAAKAETDNLKSKNKLTILPGTSLLSSVDKTNKEYAAMQKYVNDCNAFLDNYRTLSIYVSQLDKVFGTQMNEFTNSTSQLSQDTTAAQLSADLQISTIKLSAVITAMQALQPPTDMQQFNTSTIDSLTTINSDFKSLTTAVDSNDSGQINAASAKLEKDSTAMDSYFKNLDPAKMLQTNSAIHTQIVNLKAAKPLTN